MQYKNYSTINMANGYVKLFNLEKAKCLCNFHNLDKTLYTGFFFLYLPNSITYERVGRKTIAWTLFLIYFCTFIAKHCYLQGRKVDQILSVYCSSLTQSINRCYPVSQTVNTFSIPTLFFFRFRYRYTMDIF